jgi:hypothetical protein
LPPECVTAKRRRRRQRFGRTRCTGGWGMRRCWTCSWGRRRRWASWGRGRLAALAHAAAGRST